MIRLSALECGGGIEPWSLLGFDCSGSVVDIADVDLVTTPAPPGLLSWTFAASPGSVTTIGDLLVDSIPTRIVESVSPPERDHSFLAGHRVVGVDHVVVLTDDIDRTCGAIATALGLDVRRERDLGGGAFQRFFKPDNVVIEVVTNPRTPVEGASLWGLVASVEDLDGLAATLGPDATSAPKPATQPGRHISTVRPAVGLGVAVALMSPHVRVD